MTDTDRAAALEGQDLHASFAGWVVQWLDNNRHHLGEPYGGWTEGKQDG